MIIAFWNMMRCGSVERHIPDDSNINLINFNGQLIQLFVRHHPL